jgi:hypothetical protein
MLKSDDKDFIEYCMDQYKTPFFLEEEFSSDMNKTVSLKKMFKRYLEHQLINERLVLNNIITMINVFGIEATNVILFFKLNIEFYPVIKSFLLYLNSYRENEITKTVEADSQILNILGEM